MRRTARSVVCVALMDRRLALWLALLLWPLSAQAQVVERVIDGDTIVVQGVGTVRLIGIDTPEGVDPRREVQPFGREASEFTKKLTEGKTVRLEYGRERTDRYGRTLAYVYLSDGTFVNAEIVKQGYGHAYVKYPFKFLEQFRAYEREAREAKRGLWSDAVSTEQTPAADTSQEPDSGFRCGEKRTCGEMSSCAEAKFYLQQCGLTRLDRDKDGVPCETLCR
jgi:endonuclease YncB( thermonuclease family)